MRVLLFDTNLVAAKSLGNLVKHHVRDVVVHSASNVAVLEHRLAETTYDLIIADIDTTLEIEHAAAILRRVPNKDTVYLVSHLHTAEWLNKIKGSIPHKD